MLKQLLNLLAFFILVFSIPKTTSAQNVRLEVRILELEHSGIDDDGIFSGSDPRWRISPFKNGNGSGITNWIFSFDNMAGTNWDVSSPTACNGSFCTAMNIPSTNSTTFGFNFEGWEDDGCGDDDTFDDDCVFNDDDDQRICNPLVSSVNFRNTNPCTWTSAWSPWCSGEYRFRYTYRWEFVEAPTVTSQPTANTVLCLGNSTTLSAAVNSDAFSNSLGRHYQWQISENTACSGATNWQDIPGATSSSYTPQQISGTRLYRVRISSNCTANFNSNTTNSNCARVTYNPMNGTSGSGVPYSSGDLAPDIQSGICNSTILPGSSHNLNTLQPPAVNAVNGVSYTWSASGGSLSATSGPSVTYTAPSTPGAYNITLRYNSACGNRTVVCPIIVGLPACDFVYIDGTTGIDASSNGGPTNPMRTLKYAIDNAGGRTEFRITGGAYTENAIVDINNNMYIDGGWKRTGNTWEKTNSATAANQTRITFSGEGTSGSNIGHVMGFRSVNRNNWTIQDLVINTVNASGRTSGGFGKSNYGIYINNSSNYQIIRCDITSGNATDGSNGADGGNGGNGGNGGVGASGNSTGVFCNDDDGGDGGVGGSGGTPGTSPSGNPGGAGGAGGNGGAGGDDHGSATNACTINRTSSRVRGASSSTGSGGVNAGGAGGNGGVRACGSSGTGESQNTGNPGGNATNGTNGSNGGTTVSSFGIFFSPSFGTSGTGGAGGGGGGGGGGGNRDNDGCDASGSGGHAGAGGGAGGGGAEGGKGGGSSFGVYVRNSSGLIAVSEINTGTGGTGGTGGIGGSGGNAGVPNRFDNGGPDDGGAGGFGGFGGFGGNGGDGGSANAGVRYAIYRVSGSNPTLTNIIPAITLNVSPSGGNVPQGNGSSVELKAEYAKGCTNSEIYFSKSGGGSWDLAFSGFSLINNQNTSLSSFNTSNVSLTAYYANTGVYGVSRVGGWGQRTDFVRITENRPEPILNISPSPICVGGLVDLEHTNPYNNELEFSWNVYNTANATGTPVFSSTLESPTVGPFTAAGDYLVQFQVREECCGWSKFAYGTITVNEDPTVPLVLDKIPTDTDVCVGRTLTSSNASGATEGVAPYTYEYASYNDVTGVYSPWSTSVPSLSAVEGSNRIRARVQEIASLGCDASANIEVDWTGIKDPDAGSVSRLSPTTEAHCEGTDLSVQVSGATGGTGTIVDEIQYQRVNLGAAAPTGAGTAYTGPLNNAVPGEYYFRTRRTADGTDCDNSPWSNYSRLFIISETPDAGATASDQVLCINENALDVNLSGQTASANILRWELADNTSFTSPTVVANTTTTLPGSAIDSRIGTSNNIVLYARAIVEDDLGVCPEQGSDSVVIRYNEPDPVVLADATGDCVSNGVDDWVNIFDPVTGRIIASVDDLGVNLGTVTAQVFYNSGNARSVASTGSCAQQQAVLNRNFVINSSLPSPVIPNGRSVRIRLYFTDAELASLIDESLTSHSTGGALSVSLSDPNGCEDNDDVRNINDLFVTQISDITGDNNFDPNVGRFTLHTPFNSGTGDANYEANYVEFNVTEFSEFWIHGSETGVVLPVELLSFTAKAVNNQFIQLNWSTATEINNEGFEILRSKDGINFEQISFAKGYGTSSEAHFYSFQDNEVSSGTYYYQLRQVDFDGQSELSEIRSATIAAKESNIIGNFIPNPAENTSAIKFSLVSKATISVNLYDITGKKVLSKSEQLDAGQSIINFNIDDLAAGTYNERIVLGNEVHTRRLMINK